MKAIYVILFTLLILMFMASLAFGQGPSFPNTPSQAPIDGGLGIAAAAGGAYALKKLKDRKK